MFNHNYPWNNLTLLLSFEGRGKSRRLLRRAKNGGPPIAFPMELESRAPAKGLPGQADGENCIMAGMKEYYVYMLASKRNGTLYTGMTKELGKRVVRHKKGRGSRFAGDYEVNKLVYFEMCKDKQTATAREKQLKKWNRRWKIRIIEQLNPKWEDLYTKIDKE